MFYVLYVYANISRAFILFIAVWPPTTATFFLPLPLSQFFSPAILRGQILLMSNLHNKNE